MLRPYGHMQINEKFTGGTISSQFSEKIAAFE
jgi:hypothetical protein